MLSCFGILVASAYITGAPSFSHNSIRPPIDQSMSLLPRAQALMPITKRFIHQLTKWSTPASTARFAPRPAVHQLLIRNMATDFGTDGPQTGGAPHTAAMPAMLYGTAWKKERTADLVYEAIKAGFRGID